MKQWNTQSSYLALLLSSSYILFYFPLTVSMNRSFLSSNADMPGISSVLKVPTETIVSLWRCASTEQVSKARRHTTIVQLAMVVKPLASLASRQLHNEQSLLLP